MVSALEQRPISTQWYGTFNRSKVVLQEVNEQQIKVCVISQNLFCALLSFLSQGIRKQCGIAGFGKSRVEQTWDRKSFTPDSPLKQELLERIEPLLQKIAQEKKVEELPSYEPVILIEPEKPKKPVECAKAIFTELKSEAEALQRSPTIRNWQRQVAQKEEQNLSPEKLQRWAARQKNILHVLRTYADKTTYEIAKEQVIDVLDSHLHPSQTQDENFLELPQVKKYSTYVNMLRKSGNLYDDARAFVGDVYSAAKAYRKKHPEVKEDPAFSSWYAVIKQAFTLLDTLNLP